MTQITYASCRGACDQGRRECKHEGACFVTPAEACSELGADDRDDGIGCMAGLLVSICAVSVLLIIGAVIAAAF